MRKEVIGLGALNYDVLYAVERIAKGGEEVGIMDVKKAPGGSAANTIVALARLGSDAGFVGIVGNDEEGELILEEFCKQHRGIAFDRCISNGCGGHHGCG